MDVSQLLATGRRLDAGCSEGFVTLHRGEDGVFVLLLNGGEANAENRWTLALCQAVHKAFDAVEAALAMDPKGTPAALLTISGSPKFFSNGVDPAWAFSPATPKADLIEYFDLLMPAFIRPCLLPIPTICAIGGHCIGAGLMFALAFDYRIQGTGKGFLCAIEVEIGVKTPGPEMTLFRHSIPAPAFYETVLLAKRWGAEDAFRAGIVQATAPQEALLAEAAKSAAHQARLSKKRECMAFYKQEMKGVVAHEVLKYCFPEGKPKGPKALPEALQRHVDSIVTKGAWDKTWSVATQSQMLSLPGHLPSKL